MGRISRSIIQWGQLDMLGRWAYVDNAGCVVVIQSKFAHNADRNTSSLQQTQHFADIWKLHGSSTDRYYIVATRHKHADSKNNYAVVVV